MRLLKTAPSTPNTLEFSTFQSPDDISYAILSHTWSPKPLDEVQYADVLSGAAHTKPAFRKILTTMRQARLDGYDYCWVDTCCIDKTSSSELSEAINSMWRWYRHAGNCYAYLQDVSALEEVVEGEESPKLSGVMGSRETGLAESRWFSRGWTLQELLAPDQVTFFGREWVEGPGEKGGLYPVGSEKRAEGPSAVRTACIGTKATLPDVLSQITGIDPQILSGERDIRTASIAQRMSWAAKRTTTREEDVAYSLMGIFDVNMPMLYGEGSKAFWRLQEEIVKHSDDHSIFAWVSTPEVSTKTSGNDEYHGLFAESPSAFLDSAFTFNYADSDGPERPPWSITNRGLSITLPLQLWEGKDLYLATLECWHAQFQGSPGIFLKRLTEHGRQFARVRSGEMVRVNNVGTLDSIYVRQKPVVSSGLQRPGTGNIIQLANLRKFVKKSFRDPSEMKYHDYAVKEILFRGDPLDSGPQHRPNWVKKPKPFLFNVARPSSLAVVLLIQSVADRFQFVFLIGTDSKSEIRLNAMASQFGAKLGSLESYDAGLDTSAFASASASALASEGVMSMKLDKVQLNCGVARHKIPGTTSHLVSIDLYM